MNEWWLDVDTSLFVERNTDREEAGLREADYDKADERRTGSGEQHLDINQE